MGGMDWMEATERISCKKGGQLFFLSYLVPLLQNTTNVSEIIYELAGSPVFPWQDF
jgi:hypothetical protein